MALFLGTGIFLTYLNEVVSVHVDALSSQFQVKEIHRSMLC